MWFYPFLFSLNQRREPCGSGLKLWGRIKMLQLSCPTGTNDYHQGYLRSRYGAAAALGLRSAGGLPGSGPCRDVIEGLLSPLPPPSPPRESQRPRFDRSHALGGDGYVWVLGIITSGSENGQSISAPPWAFLY